MKSFQTYHIKPGREIRLKDYDPDDRSGFSGVKEQAQIRLLQLNRKLEALQEMLYAEHRHKVLIILQAIDTAGKDSVIRQVFEGVNPQGVRVASFKVPTPVELDHDYLWRAHQQMPGRGEIAIFNRSYYEDILVVRVHNLVPPRIWKRRYDQINAFERMLAEEGTVILKFFLQIDPQEQKRRLQSRQKDPSKAWKFNRDDLKERLLWKEYTRAYEAALSKTSTAHAPWYLIPSNTKWYRNLVVASILVEQLEGMKLRYPILPKADRNIVIR